MLGKVIFVSYSHDSAEHREHVLRLAERLRQDGLDAQLDQYVQGTPSQGWPRWMLDRLDEAAFVLVVCTATYYRRFRGHEIPGRGRGVDWEGALITQEIYDARSQTVKFVPVTLEAGQESFIPEPLRGQTGYELTSEESYQALYKFLLGQAGVEPSPLGHIHAVSRWTAQPLTFDQAPSPPPSTGRSTLFWLVLPTLILLPLVVFSMYWHLPTRIQLEIPTARLALTPGGKGSHEILAPTVSFSSLILENCGRVTFSPKRFAVADPKQLIPASNPSEKPHYPASAWRELKPIDRVKFSCVDPNSKVTLRAGNAALGWAGTLDRIHFELGTQVILEALPGKEPALSVEVAKPLHLSLPLADELELVTDRVKPDGIEVPFSGDLLNYWAQIQEGRRQLKVESGPRGLVVIVTPTRDQLGSLFAKPLQLPVSEVEFLGENREGAPSTQLRDRAILSYPELPKLPPATIAEEEAIGLRGLSKAQLTSLELDTKEISGPALRAHFDGIVKHATSQSGEFTHDYRLTLYDIFRYRWRWNVLAVAAVWLLSTSWAAFKVWIKKPGLTKS